MEVSEREWLAAGFFWMILGAAGTIPWSGHMEPLAQITRWVFCAAVVVHLLEAFCSMALARRAKLEPGRWFWRGLMLGLLALIRLQKQRTVQPQSN